MQNTHTPPKAPSHLPPAWSRPPLPVYIYIYIYIYTHIFMYMIYIYIYIYTYKYTERENKNSAGPLWATRLRRIRLQVYVLQTWFRAWLLVCLLLECLIALYLNWLVVRAPWMNIFTFHFATCLSPGISSKSSQNEPPEPNNQGRPRWHPRLQKPFQILEKSSPRTSGSYFWCYLSIFVFWTTVQRI